MQLKALREIFNVSLMAVKPLVEEMRTSGFWVTRVESEYLAARLKMADIETNLQHGVHNGSTYTSWGNEQQ
ncbi:hypothetical protein ACH4S8_41235 [Streptomyces sp. NPDC021080]|uniref:hypothetical protein n=1 Tax=Streptomyces sp. NPDC021080 TaxID=3365110 RepID=UPI003797767B